jgi:hypothetical protein
MGRGSNWVCDSLAGFIDVLDRCAACGIVGKLLGLPPLLS